MIQMHMVTGTQETTHAQAAVSICNLVNETLATFQEEDNNPEDIKRVETHLSRERVAVWNGNELESIRKYQYIAFIWMNE
jgi:hypothetical protein